MSIRAMNWAYRQATGSPTGKAILVTLGDHADDYGRCWPSHARIAAYCEVDKRTVKRQLRALEQLGLLTVRNRFTPSGRQTTDLYQLNLSVEVPIALPDEPPPDPTGEDDNLSPSPEGRPKAGGGEGDNLPPSEGDNLSGGGCQIAGGRVTPVSPLEPSVEASPPAHTREGPTDVENPDPEFSHEKSAAIDAELEEYLGEHGPAAMEFLRSMDRYTPMIGLGIVRQYGPGSPLQSIWKGVELADRPPILATAILRAGSEAERFQGAFFASVVRRVIEEWKLPAPVDQARARSGNTPAGRLTAEQEADRDRRKRLDQQRAKAAERSATHERRVAAERTEEAELRAWIATLSPAGRRALERRTSDLMALDGWKAERPPAGRLKDAYELRVARKMRQEPEWGADQRAGDAA